MKIKALLKDIYGRVFVSAAAVLLLCGGILALLEVPLLMDTQRFTVGSRYVTGEGDFTAILCADPTDQRSKLQSIKQYFHQAGGDLLLLEGTEEEAEAAIVQLLENQPAHGPFLLLGYGHQAARASRLQVVLANASPFGMEKVAGTILLSPVTTAGEEIVVSDTSLLILGTSSDTAPSPAQLTDLYNRLSGDTIKPSGMAIRAERDRCRLEIVSGVVDAYQGYSKDILGALSDWCGNQLPIPTGVSTLSNSVRLTCWIGILVALIALLASGYHLAEQKLIDLAYSVVPLQVVDRNKFLLAKAFTWLMALPMLAVLLLVFWILPIELPIWSLTFCGYLFCYGCVTAALYQKKWMPGVKGTLSLQRLPRSSRRTLLGVGAMAMIVLYLVGLGASGLFTLRFEAAQLPWFLLFTAMSGVTYYFLLLEQLLLEQAKFPLRILLFTTLIPLLPVVALLVFSLPAAGFTTLLALCMYLGFFLLLLLAGQLIQLLSGRTFLAAAFCAILLSGFMAFGAI